MGSLLPIIDRGNLGMLLVYPPQQLPSYTSILVKAGGERGGGAWGGRGAGPLEAGPA